GIFNGFNKATRRSVYGWKYNPSASEVGAGLVGGGSVLRYRASSFGAAGESGGGQEGRQGRHLRHHRAAGHDPYRKGIRGQIRAQGRILARGRHEGDRPGAHRVAWGQSPLFHLYW